MPQRSGAAREGARVVEADAGSQRVHRPRRIRHHRNRLGARPQRGPWSGSRRSPSYLAWTEARQSSPISPSGPRLPYFFVGSTEDRRNLEQGDCDRMSDESTRNVRPHSHPNNSIAGRRGRRASGGYVALTFALIVALLALAGISYLALTVGPPTSYAALPSTSASTISSASTTTAGSSALSSPPGAFVEVRDPQGSGGSTFKRSGLLT